MDSKLNQQPYDLEEAYYPNISSPDNNNNNNNKNNAGNSITLTKEQIKE